MKLYQFSLSVICCFISVLTIAQSENSETKGKKKKISIDVAQFTVDENNFTEVAPSIIILNTTTVSVPTALHPEVYALIEEDDKLYKYRYLHDISEATTYTSFSQKTERTMSNFRKGVGPYNYISNLLEKNLQHKLQEYFASPVSYAYPMVPDSVNSLNDIGNRFNAQWVIHPAILQIDTPGGIYLSELQLIIWDTKTNKLINQRVFSVKEQDMESSITKLIQEVENYIMGQLMMDSEYRNAARLSEKRKKAFKDLIAAQSDIPEIETFITKEIGAENLFGTLANKEKDKFIAFTLKPYTPGFKDKISTKVFKNPYPEIDLTIDQDPQRARFRTTTYIGLKLNGNWTLYPVTEDYIYTSDTSKAEGIYSAKFANMGFFENGSEKLKEPLWMNGMLTPIDTAVMVSTYNPEKVKNAGIMFAVDKLNAAHFQGYPKIMEFALKYEYNSKVAGPWQRKTRSEQIEPLLQNKNFWKDLNIKDIDLEKQRIELIHDFEMSRAIIPVWTIDNKGSESLRFFYWEKVNPQILYEWTYLPAFYPEDDSKPKGSYVFDQMNKMVPWSFSGIALDDKFWEEFVLNKEENAYKYLNKVLD